MTCRPLINFIIIIHHVSPRAADPLCLALPPRNRVTATTARASSLLPLAPASSRCYGFMHSQKAGFTSAHCEHQNARLGLLFLAGVCCFRVLAR
jgi:hypothetical protein